MVCNRSLLTFTVAASLIINIFPLFAFGQTSYRTAQSAVQAPCAITEPIFAEPAKDPNADRLGSGPWYINADRTIWAGVNIGEWKSGIEGNKVLWIRPQGKQLTVTGKRLDSSSGRLKAIITEGYPTGFQTTELFFSMAGCWRVTATAGPNTLTFVTRIQ